MPRKPLDAVEHGGRLMKVGANIEQQNARLQALRVDSARSAPKLIRVGFVLEFAGLVLRLAFICRLAICRACAAVRPRRLAAHKAHRYRPRSGSDYVSSEILRRRRSEFLTVDWFRSAVFFVLESVLCSSDYS